MTADLVADMAAVVAVAALLAVCGWLVAGLNPLPELAPDLARESDNPTVGISLAKARKAAAKALEARDRSAVLAVATAPPPVVASVPYVAAGRHAVATAPRTLIVEPGGVAVLPRQRVICPTCGEPKAGPLAECLNEACWRRTAWRDADLDHWREV